MESKYYTPTIEEFCVGFEYELLDDSDNWLWSNIPQDLELLKKCIKDKRCRAKYIDKEDLINLGLKEKVWHNGGGYFEKGIYSIGIYTTRLFCMIGQNDGGNNIIRFSGNLKNKTELKKLLVQLEIL